MAKVQTRRSISLPRDVYDRLLSDSIQLQIPMTRLVALACERLLDLDDETIVALDARRPGYHAYDERIFTGEIEGRRKGDSLDPAHAELRRRMDARKHGA